MINEIETKIAELKALCQRLQVERLELFGSAAGDRFDPKTSDLDFLVQFRPMSSGDHADCYFGLQCALGDLFGRPIDLVELPAIRNPFFLKAIASSRVMLYAA